MARLRIIPGVLDIELYRGATFDVTMTVREETETGEPGPVIPLTGYSARMQLRLKPGAPVLDELSTDNDRITIDGPAGKLRLFTDADATGAYTFKAARHDVELTDADGRVWPLVAGAFDVVEEITA